MAAGSRLGPYELTSLLGAGGMGEVYRAHDSRLNRTVAVKILPPAVATADRLRRFEQEARAASALNHPNILTIHDVGRDGDVSYVAMEWIEGQTLRSVLGGARLTIKRIVELATQVAEGLAKAHAAGIVHRDIKPENVMVSDDGFVKIIDFGLATLAADTADASHSPTVDRTRTATAVAGTVGYISPEQASGHAIDHRADQFALGVMLYEMATRIRPFERATTAQSLVAMLEVDPTPVEALNREVPAPLATIVRRCLAKSPEGRYESTRDLARDLRQVGDNPQASGALDPGTRRIGRRTAIAGAIATALIVFAAAASWRRPTAEQPPSEPPVIAVRPFRNLSTEETQPAFAAGVTQQIHDKLSQISGLRLLSRRAMSRYAEGDTGRMARELGVDDVVEGSVRIDGPTVHVEARLVAADGRSLWSAVYDVAGAEVLAVPGAIALRVVETLPVSMSPDQRGHLERRPTESLDAYLFYLQWLRAGTARTDRASRYRSLDPLRKAIAIDPNYASAQAALAMQLAIMGAVYDGQDALLAEAMANAEEALRHDAASSDAHGSIAVAHLLRGQAGLARLSFQRGITVDPNNGTNMNNLSFLEKSFGRLADGLEWARRAFVRSGRYGIDYYHVASPLISLRDDDQSLRWLLEGERLHPTYQRLQQEFALLELLSGRAADALTRARRSLARGPTDNADAIMALAEIAYLADAPDLEALTEPILKDSAAATSVWLGETARVRFAYAVGRRGDTRRMTGLLAEAEAISKRRLDGGDETPLRRIELGAIAALTRDHDGALDWLSRAFDSGYREYGLLERDPAFTGLRGQPRFLALLDAMKRDVGAQRQAARERGLLDFDRLLDVGNVAAATR